MENNTSSNRPKMEREMRAKQFMPFDALKGFREALAEKEHEVELKEQRTYMDDLDESEELGRDMP